MNTINTATQVLQPDCIAPKPPSPKAEVDILAHWHGNIATPLVSIICHTYNHHDYIEDALNGFLMQETSFPFEIIVHDDASTDGTTDIVRNYSSRYPSIIRPILQAENQFSKGNKPVKFTFPAARGKFIALCEGDDYWIHPQKLSRQVSVFENDSSCTLSFHNAIEVNTITQSQKIICRSMDFDGIIKSQECIKNRGGFMPTASLMFRNEKIDALLTSYKNAPIGDFFLQSYLALAGSVHYLDLTACVYRRNNTGSWTNEMINPEKSQVYNSRMVDAIDEFYNHVRHMPLSNTLIYPLAFYLLSYSLSFMKNTDKVKFFSKKILNLSNFNIFLVTYLVLKGFARRKLNLRSGI